MGKVRILYRAGTINLQAAAHPKFTLGAQNMKEEERRKVKVNFTLEKATNAQRRIRDIAVLFL